jgi:transcriptional regulator with XRE-family HTH domain
MVARPHHRTAAGGPEAIGALLTRLRLARGYSQLRLAERLCAAAGTPTVSRHEVSRWEREERVPGSFWLGWLAVVLDTPLEELEAAVAASSREAPGSRAGSADHGRLWQPPAPGELLAALDHASGHDLRELAHTWLAGPPELGSRLPDPSGPAAPPPPPAGPPAPPDPVSAAPPPPPAAPPPPPTGPPDPVSAAPLDRLELRLGELRRMDDLVGGVDLARLVDRELRTAVAVLRATRAPRPDRRALRLVAQFGQLAGWVHTDAGDRAAALRAYRVALRAAAASRDQQLAGHVLGCLSHLSLATGDPQQALLLARTARAGIATGGSGLTQALLLHRMALAAAGCGERRVAHAALAAAERVADRSRPGQEPPWLYWLDPPELSAMTGRCLASLGRPLRAARRLSDPRPGLGPRTSALYAAWLARSYLELGEVELACRVAMRGLRSAVRSGSARAATALRHLHPLLLRHRDVPAVRGYERLAAVVSGYLPTPVQPWPGAGRSAAAGGAQPARPPPPGSVAG